MVIQSVLAVALGLGVSPAEAWQDALTPQPAAAIKPVDMIQLPDWATKQRPGGVAIGGIDPVSYFDEGTPTPGREDIVSEWHGATFRFATPEHKAMFDADPEHFAPVYGGLDPEALVEGKVVAGDPLTWTIYGDRLYLSVEPATAAAFRSHQSETVNAAGGTWRLIEDRDHAPRFFIAHDTPYEPCRAVSPNGTVAGCKSSFRLKGGF